MSVLISVHTQFYWRIIYCCFKRDVRKLYPKKKKYEYSFAWKIAAAWNSNKFSYTNSEVNSTCLKCQELTYTDEWNLKDPNLRTVTKMLKTSKELKHTWQWLIKIILIRTLNNLWRYFRYNKVLTANSYLVVDLEFQWSMVFKRNERWKWKKI